MRKALLACVALAAIALTPSVSLAQCEGLTNGKCISGFLYGNTSNPKDGTGPGVEPSLAPGPWACVYELGECQGDETDAGVSVGDLVGNGKSNFANGKEVGPGFGKK